MSRVCGGRHAYNDTKQRSTSVMDVDPLWQPMPRGGMAAKHVQGKCSEIETCKFSIFYLVLHINGTPNFKDKSTLETAVGGTVVVATLRVWPTEVNSGRCRVGLTTSPSPTMFAAGLAHPRVRHRHQRRTTDENHHRRTSPFERTAVMHTLTPVARLP